MRRAADDRDRRVAALIARLILAALLAPRGWFAGCALALEDAPHLPALPTFPSSRKASQAPDGDTTLPTWMRDEAGVRREL